MRVSLKWLRQYVPISLSPEALARRLTLGTAEVEAIERIGGWDEQIVVGEVLAVEPHPNADRLRLATVRTGAGEQTVVCGAPNVAAGQRIAFAGEGATVFNTHSGKREPLKANKIRGVLSAGMVLSEKELELSDDHEGILVLPEDAPVGTPLRDYLGDVVLELSTWANRPDLMSMLGIAREVAALTGERSGEPDLAYPEAGAPAAERIAIRIDDPDLCRRYVGAVVENVTIGPSPRWLQERLLAAGQRPIDVIVDITNYVMFEYGVPLHAFDYDLVRGREIIVRRARPGERLTLIDGVEREMTADMLLITDGAGPTALAGIMGGQASEIGPTTRTVFLEAANFYGPNIRRTAQTLKMRTEGSARWEKGVSPDLAELAARRAVQLMVELAGGTAAPGLVDIYPGREERPPLVVPAARLRQVLGVELPQGQVRDVLTALGFTVEVRPEAYVVGVPYWRTDIQIPDDIAEEVIRIVGYDDLPNTTIAGRLPAPIEQPLRDLRERAVDLLVAAGMQEVITYSAVSLDLLAKVLPREELELTPPLRLANPLSAQHEVMRTTLRGSVLETLARNLRRPERAEVAIFEAAPAFLRRPDDLPDEDEVIVGAVGGRRADRWGQPSDEPLDFADAKGYVEALFKGLRVPVRFEAADEHGFLPGRSGAIIAGEGPVGVLGQLHPHLRAAFDLEREAFLFEVRLAPLLPLLADRVGYRGFSRFEAVRRDLALVVDEHVPAAALLATIMRGKGLIVDARPFDEFRGGALPAGKKSIAFAITFQAPDRTLTDHDVDQALNRLLRQLDREHGATRR